jgi:ribonuclease HI
MGALFDMKAFFSWLETTSERELLQRRDQLEHAIQNKLTNVDVITDARYLLKQIEQEMLVRTML